jgi:sigma-B regulation protein RsbU (phosphoserine phosphatase)
MKVLVIDDQVELRLSVVLHLKKFGYTVIEADDGRQGWDILLGDPDISLVISDWDMPEMNGIELCKTIRAFDLGRYVYVLLLTAKGEREHLLAGLDAGADDFLVKPVNTQELKLRLRNGERVVMLERNLAEQNERLKEAYARITIDLQAAAKLQRNLLPNAADQRYPNVRFDALYTPCEFVAGDTYNLVELDDAHIGLYAIDAAGHGIPAAMLSVTMHKMLTPEISSLEAANLLRRATDTPPFYEIVAPKDVVTHLNALSQNESDAMHYFTMVYAVLNRQTGHLRLCLGGHPLPILVRATGHSEMLGENGFPVGMLPELEYEEVSTLMESGDRLFFYSDGIVECANERGNNIFTSERLQILLQQCSQLSLQGTIEHLRRELIAWRGSEKFDDDISLLALERL